MTGTSWPQHPLAELCLPVDKMDPVVTGRECISYIDIGSIPGPTRTLGDIGLISADEAPTRCRQVVRAGDTVYSTVRPYLEKIAFVDDRLDGEFASTGFAVLRPGPTVDPKFLFYFALSKQMADQVLPNQRGVSYPAVRDKEVRQTQMPVPALVEQRRIVDILEDHLSRLDAADAELETASTRLQALRDRVTRDAITGAHVPQRGVKRPADAGTADGDLPGLPVGWEWARLGDVADVVGGVTKDAKKQSDPDYVEVPYLRVANVQRGHLLLDNVTSIRVPPAKAEALKLEPGDVLLNEGGDRDKLARGWVWEGQIENCIHQNHVFRARVRDPRLDPYFLSLTANTIGGRWAERNGKQSVNLASISLRVIRKMPVIVPAAGSTELALKQLREDLNTIDRLESAVAAARERGAVLRRALLRAAFAGELTGGSSELSAVEEMIGA